MLISNMRVRSSKYLLALLALSAGLSDAIPTKRTTKIRFEQRSTNGTDAFFTEQDIKDGVAGDAALRKIDWKIVKGGLKWSYKPLTLLIGATSTAFTIMTAVKMNSNQNSCEPIWGSQYSDDGTQGINIYYVTNTGSNCDTTAQTKTIADAIEGAWNTVMTRGTVMRASILAMEAPGTAILLLLPCRQV